MSKSYHEWIEQEGRAFQEERKELERLRFEPTPTDQVIPLTDSNPISEEELSKLTEEMKYEKMPSL